MELPVSETEGAEPQSAEDRHEIFMSIFILVLFGIVSLLAGVIYNWLIGDEPLPRWMWWAAPAAFIAHWLILHVTMNRPRLVESANHADENDDIPWPSPWTSDGASAERTTTRPSTFSEVGFYICGAFVLWLPFALLAEGLLDSIWLLRFIQLSLWALLILIAGAAVVSQPSQWQGEASPLWEGEAFSINPSGYNKGYEETQRELWERDPFSVAPEWRSRFETEPVEQPSSSSDSAEGSRDDSPEQPVLEMPPPPQPVPPSLPVSPETRCFISHSTEDRAQASVFAHDLESHGILSWLAYRDVKAGADYAQSIVEAIETCSMFVILLSPSSTASEHCLRELALALDSRRSVVPVWLEPHDLPGGFRYRLSTLQVTEFENAASIIADLLRS